jgi:2-polyprenyl-6-methoxyphenol hydroxylase-like FAD-dependent oxidoreductase
VPVAAFAEYERRRADRAAWIVDESRAFGALGQWESGPARLVRDMLLRLTPSSFTLRRMRHLYAFDP